jgi:hypothetical protein
MTKTKELNPREATFCVHFTTIGADTFGDGTKSATAADYSENSAHVAASRLLKRDKVKKRIRELHKKNMAENLITTEKVLTDLEHDKLMARRHKQFSVAARCTELQGKYLSMFTDNANTAQQPEHEPLSKEEIAELKRLAGLTTNIKYKRTS